MVKGNEERCGWGGFWYEDGDRRRRRRGVSRFHNRLTLAETRVAQPSFVQGTRLQYSFVSQPKGECPVFFSHVHLGVVFIHLAARS